MTGDPSVVIFGGSGFFGRRVADDLIAHTRCRVLLAGRRVRLAVSSDSRITFACSDFRDPVALGRTLAGAAVVVHCAGPYTAQQPLIAESAIEAGAHYVDLAEDRAFIDRVNALGERARQAGVTLLSGLSVVPGLAALLACALAGRHADLVAARTFVAPGTRGSRGLATIESLLAAAGSPLSVFRDGRDVQACGWSEPEWLLFPPPVGRRLLYLAIGTGGSDPMHRELGAANVEFKAGSEFAWLNRLLAAAASLRCRFGVPRLERWSPMLKEGLKMIGWMGTDRGAVCVEIVQLADGSRNVRRIAVVADSKGERIPAVLAGMATGALLKGEIPTGGVPSLAGLFSPLRIGEELRLRGLRLWEQHSSGAWGELEGLDEASP